MNEWFLYAFIVYQGGTFQPIGETYPTEKACRDSFKVLLDEKYINGKYYAKCLPIGKWVDEGRRELSEVGRVAR